MEIFWGALFPPTIPSHWQYGQNHREWGPGNPRRKINKQGSDICPLQAKTWTLSVNPPAVDSLDTRKSLAWTLEQHEGWAPTPMQPKIMEYLKSTLCIHGSVSLDSTNHRSCSTAGCIYWKKYTHKWTCTFQTHAVQGSTACTWTIT